MSGQWWVLALGGCIWLLISEIERHVRRRGHGRIASLALHLLAVSAGLLTILVYGGGRWHDILPFVLVVLGVVSLNWLFIGKLRELREKRGRREP